MSDLLFAVTGVHLFFTWEISNKRRVHRDEEIRECFDVDLKWRRETWRRAILIEVRVEL